MFSHILILSQCRPLYLLHIQLSPVLQQVFSIHCCFNSRPLSVGYCYLLEAHFEPLKLNLSLGGLPSQLWLASQIFHSQRHPLASLFSQILGFSDSQRSFRFLDSCPLAVFSQILILSPSCSSRHSVALSPSRIVILLECSLRFSDSRPLALPSSLSTSHTASPVVQQVFSIHYSSSMFNVVSKYNVWCSTWGVDVQCGMTDVQRGVNVQRGIFDIECTMCHRCTTWCQCSTWCRYSTWCRCTTLSIQRGVSMYNVMRSAWCLAEMEMEIQHSHIHIRRVYLLACRDFTCNGNGLTTCHY